MIFSALVLSICISIIMFISFPLPWYFETYEYRTTISNGRVYSDIKMRNEYFYTIRNREIKKDSKSGVTLDQSTDTEWKDSPFSRSLLTIINATAGVGAISFVSSVLAVISIILLILSIQKGTVRSKYPLKIAILVANGLMVLTLVIGLISLFVYFTHTPRYRSDVIASGNTCDSGACSTFFWAKKTSQVDGNTELIRSWGPDSGWILFFVILFAEIGVSILTSPFILKRYVYDW